ncbi:antitoxin Xre/MbcA/ParS toxin-binding domain-containing protein [Pontiella sp.]|uniref:type II RES/Xre toxin-antitoxin system antitoxin n=1 Tax=Pontiella sp. TaxID=2837462 RepID=UPI0035665862
MSGQSKIEKQTYTWEAETMAVNEAALKYEVSLEARERNVPELKLVDSDNVLEQVAEIKAGLPAGIVDALCRELEISRKELARVAGVAERTLNRKIQEGRLNADQSERFNRIAQLLNRAVDVLGTKELAVRWLKGPRSYFGGKAPLDFADTELGNREVLNLLGRIEHGVFS